MFEDVGKKSVRGPNIVGMSTTKVIPSRRICAFPELQPSATEAEARAFLVREFFVAKVSGDASLEIEAPAELLPLLATAAGSVDADDLPENFRLVEMVAEEG